MLGFIFAEYQIGLKALLRCSDMTTEDPSFSRYLASLGNVRKLLNYLYFAFIQNLDV